MTLGVVLSNGKEAAVLTDRRVIEHDRKDDSVVKFKRYRAHGYHGILFWAGSRELSQTAINRSKDSQPDDFACNRDYIHHIKGALGSILREKQEEYLSDAMDSIDSSAASVPDDEREQFVKKERAQAEQSAEGYRRRIVPVFGFCAFEKNQYHSEHRETESGEDVQHIGLKIRLLEQEKYKRITSNFLVIGAAGGDADSYLRSEGASSDTSDMDLSELVFHVMKAYTTSLYRYDVGGTPDLNLVTPDRVITYTNGNTQRALLANIMVAHHAKLTPSLASEEVCRQMIEGIINNLPNYQMIIVDALKDSPPNILAGMNSLRRERERAHYFAKHPKLLTELDATPGKLLNVLRGNDYQP